MEQGAQLAELNGSGVWQHSNIYASGGRLVATYDAPSQPVPGYHYNLTDWLGTKRVQTTAGGGPQETCLSYPFGDGLACSGGTDATEQHFTGKDRDAESGLDYFYARYYNSNLGRFLTPDRAAKPAAVPYASYGDPQSLNLYAYVQNNPNTGIDLGGHAPWITNGGTPIGMSGYEDLDDSGIEVVPSVASTMLAAAQTEAAGTTTTSGSSAQAAPPTPAGDDNKNPQQVASNTQPATPGSTAAAGTSSTTTTPNPNVSVAADALSVAGVASKSTSLGVAGAIIGLANDPSPQNAVMTGLSFVPEVGPAITVLGLVKDVGISVGNFITNDILAPMFNAAPAQTDPALMDETEMIMDNRY